MSIKNHPIEIVWDNLEMINNDENLLKKVIIGDKSWVYGHQPETKHQSSQWKHASSPRQKKTLSKSEQCQVNVDCFFFLLIL